MEQWRADNTSVYRGVKDPAAALFTFFSNFPWREDLPCAGTFVFRPVPAAVRALQEWWDYDIPQRNLEDFMEQVCV